MTDYRLTAIRARLHPEASILVPIGWRHIIVELDEIISSYDPDYQVYHIGSGGGRMCFVFVLSNKDDVNKTEVARIVHQYETLTSLTCEICSYGVVGKYDVGTYCDRCYTTFHLMVY